MKSHVGLILIALLLVACSAAPSEKPGLTPIEKTIIITPVRMTKPGGTEMPTQTVTSTTVPSATQTITPSMTLSASADVSFNNLDDCLPENGLTQTGIVTEVIDGDTIIVRLEDGNIYSVRYIGIDAPERTEASFAEAYNANADMVLGKEVILVRDVSERDQYDRLLRYVIIGDVFINLELVKAGFARPVQYPPDVACAATFSSAEESTRASQIGIIETTLTPEATLGQVAIQTVNKKDEYVDIQNVGDTDIDLAGWKLVSERGYQECYLSGVIAAGETLRIWAGSAQAGGFSCGYSSPIWNNSEVDPAVLYNAQGVEVSRK